MMACRPDDMHALKASAQSGLESLRASFLVRMPFLAMVSLRLDLVAIVDDRVGTAATNGRTIYVDARFYAGCSAEKREFVFAHEVWHCALGHFSRVKGRNPRLWNIAADHEINGLLAADGFPMPEDAVFFPDMKGQSAEEVYANLLRNGCAEMQGFDLHLLGQLLPDPEADGYRDPDFHPDEPTPSATDADTLLVAAVRATEARKGAVAGHIKAKVDELTRPRVNWQALLAQYLQDALAARYTWARAQRRHLHRGLYLPTRRATGLRPCVAVDISGSVFDLMGDFLSEVRGISGLSGVEEIDLILFDTDIRHRKTINGASDLAAEMAHLHRGGGTNFEPVFEAIRYALPAVLILLTDGFGKAPDQPPDCPVLWALTGGGRRPTDWGDVISLPPSGYCPVTRHKR